MQSHTVKRLLLAEGSLLRVGRAMHQISVYHNVAIIAIDAQVLPCSRLRNRLIPAHHCSNMLVEADRPVWRDFASLGAAKEVESFALELRTCNSVTRMLLVARPATTQPTCTKQSQTHTSRKVQSNATTFTNMTHTIITRNKSLLAHYEGALQLAKCDTSWQCGKATFRQTHFRPLQLHPDFRLSDRPQRLQRLEVPKPQP